MSFIVTPGSVACVPVHGDVGAFIEIGEWFNGNGFRKFEHTLVYVGYYTSTPDVGRAVPIDGSGAGHYVVEAMPGGARLRRLYFPPANYPGAWWSTNALCLSDAQRQQVVSAALTYLDTPYSFLDYEAIFLHRLQTWHVCPPLPGLRNYIADSGHMICSQLADQCLLDANYHLFDDGRWPGFVTPLAIANRFLALVGGDLAKLVA